jgi:N-acylneuraminate cytidylyltransferase/CMP-N,N'-diacetyllegionaminic acid synthase
MAGTGLLIVVPARGGSRGLPRKNARSLGGIPLLAWTAEAIRRSGITEATCVLSTDDGEIAKIGRDVGLEVPFTRPAELATDTATAESVALHALDWLARERGVHASALMWLQPTSPFRDPGALRRAIDLLEDPGCQGVLGVKPINRTLRTLFHADGAMQLAPVDPNAGNAVRRQEVRPMYTPNGALYLVRSAALVTAQTLFPAGCRGIVMDGIASIDIDGPEDWALAEAVAAAGLTWRGATAPAR